MKKTNSLVVLGNGFDLNCKLNSKFSQFFAKKIESIRAQYKCYHFSELNNFWYLLFFFAYYDDNAYERSDFILIERINDNDCLWMEIEGFIKKIMTPPPDATRYRSLSKNYCSRFASIFDERLGSQRPVINCPNQITAIREYFRLKFPRLPNMNIYDFLFVELMKFESDFEDYLSNEINNCENYTNLVSFTFEYLVSKYCENFSLISFNYTDIASILQNNNYSLKSSTNIHGLLGQRIIIGYDSKDMDMSNLSSIKLTKAWQKMDTGLDIYQLPEKGTIDTIKIYGHSLGEQDYSYFHAIFDYYDIYNSSVKLMFFYTEYSMGENENRAIRNEFLTSVFSLLNNYAAKSRKEDDVRTIVSRLQLENRLLIRRVPYNK